MTLTKINPAHSIGIAAIAFLLLLGGFYAAEGDLITAWQTEEYSHGFMIPLIAILIGWHRLTEKPPAIKPSWWGLAFLAFALLLQMISALSAFGMAAQYGIVFGITGILLACWGRQATWRVMPALVYLLFAIPLPHLLQADLSQRLQLISSSLGVWPLDAIGIPVYQEGNVIDLGGYKLQVVEACGGLRYLFPLMSFGYLVAMLLEDRPWKRATVFLSTIPISIALNSLRITVIGITVDKWGQAMAEGFIHTFEGWVVFMLCLAILLGETTLLLKIGGRGHFKFNYVALPRGMILTATEAKPSPAFGALAGVIGMIAVSMLAQSGTSTEIIPPHPAFDSFPTQFGDWQGRQDHIAPDVLDALKLSDYWLADYQNGASKSGINFYIAYYDSQRVGTTTHSPSNCIPGGGWQITDSHVTTIKLDHGAEVTATRLIIRKGSEADLVYYWFDERGRDLTETYYAKWYLLLDSITMHRTDGALLRLVTHLADGEPEAKGDERLHDFLKLAYPSIKDFIPGMVVGNSVSPKE